MTSSLAIDLEQIRRRALFAYRLQHSSPTDVATEDVLALLAETDRLRAEIEVHVSLDLVHDCEDNAISTRAPARETAIGALLELCDWIVDDADDLDIEDIVARASEARDLYAKATR